MKISWATLWGSWQMSSLVVDWGHQTEIKPSACQLKCDSAAEIWVRQLFIKDLKCVCVCVLWGELLHSWATHADCENYALNTKHTERVRRWLCNIRRVSVHPIMTSTHLLMQWAKNPLVFKLKIKHFSFEYIGARGLAVAAWPNGRGHEKQDRALKKTAEGCE